MEKLKIGWARRDISTDKPVGIPGQHFLRRSEGVAEPLYCTVLAVENGDSAIFVSLDIVTLPEPLLDDVRARVKALSDKIPLDKIIMSATHTHAGPGYERTPAEELSVRNAKYKMPDTGIAFADYGEYKDFLVQTVAEAIAEAYEKRKEGGIAYGYGYAAAAYNRRPVYSDYNEKEFSLAGGRAVMYGNTALPGFSHYEGGADPFVNILFAFDKASKLTGAIVNVPCPSQCTEDMTLLSADYWHELRNEIVKTYDGIYILGQCAGGGDLAPHQLHYKKAQERRFRLKYGAGTERQNQRKDIAQRIAAAFDEVYSWAVKDIRTDLKVKHITESLPLSKRTITAGEYEFCKKQVKDLEGEPFSYDKTNPTAALYHNTQLNTMRALYLRVMERYEKQKPSPKLLAETHAVSIGGVSFATNVFELYSDYMHRIQARSPFIQTFVVQLAANSGASGDWSYIPNSYLPTQRAVEGKGYGSTVLEGMVSPAGGQELVEGTLKMLDKLYKGNDI